MNEVTSTGSDDDISDIQGIEAALTETSITSVAEVTTTPQPVIEEPAYTMDEPIEQVVDQPKKVEVVKPDVEDEPPLSLHNFNVKFDYSMPNVENSNFIPLSLPSFLRKNINYQIAKAPNINLAKGGRAPMWADTIKDSFSFIPFGDIFEKCVEKPGSDWEQSISFQGRELSGSSPKFAPIENAKLSGEKALLQIRSYLGMGSTFQVPLWHSGFWITLKAAEDAEIIELNRQIIADKIEFGRSTYGMAYSHTTSYTSERIVRFVLDHVYETTIDPKESQNLDLRSIIVTQDLSILIWGMVCTMYPNGFNYRRSCLYNADKCNEVIEAMLNVSKLSWVNTPALTEWQRTHISIRRPGSKSLANIAMYREQMTAFRSKTVTISNEQDISFKVTFKSPFLSEYIDSGHRWIASITDMVNRVLNSESSDAERNAEIERHGQATVMRQYVHWVESLEFNNGNVVEDRDTIEKTCEMLSSNDGIRNSFHENISDYIAESTIALIGIPAFDCPKCKKDQSEEHRYKEFKNIIPLDVIMLFFDLHTQRFEQIIQR